MKKLLLVKLLLIAFVQISNSQTVPVTLKLSNPNSNVDVSVATLKYNKDFAYSFTLDDGKITAYTNVFPVLNGGKAENGVDYSGIFFSDGCGNKIKFKAGIGWTSKNAHFEDGHTGNNPDVMTWSQLRELYDNGWNVFNHSLNHKDGDGTDYNLQVKENNQYVKEKIGVDLKHFVIPSGDTAYIEPAFSNGMVAIYNQNYFPGRGGLQINKNTNLNRFKLHRTFLNTEYNETNVSDELNNVASKSNANTHYWYTEFTHHVSAAPSESSMHLNTFLAHMNNIETNYGIKGKDNIWMAPLQDVFEYLQVMQKVKITSEKRGSDIVINLDFSEVPRNLNKYAITLNIVSDQSFTIDATENTKFTYNNKMVNLEWDEFPGSFVATGTLTEDKNQILAYINDNNDLEFFDLTVGKFEVQLFSIQGILIEKSQIESKEVINLDRLPSGIYQVILKDLNSGFIKSSRIFKK